MTAQGKRPREEDEPAAPDPDDAIRKQIVSAGDKYALVNKDVEELAKAIDGAFTASRVAVTETFGHCCVEIPAKAHIYAAALGLVNVLDHDVCATLLAYVVDLWPRTVAEGNPFRLRALVRFLVQLAPARVIGVQASASILQMLASAALTAVSSAGADSVISSVFSALPFVARLVHEQHPGDLASLMEDLEDYMSKRTTIQASSLRIFPDSLERTSGTTDTAENISESWARIRQLAAAGWQMPFLPKTFETFAGELEKGRVHTLAPLSSPLIKTVSTTVLDMSPYLPLTSQRLLRIFDRPTNLGELVDVGWWLTTELYVDTLYFFEINHKVCTNRLAMVNAPPLPMDSILVEVLFAQMLCLPQPLFKPVYYSTLINNLAKAVPTFMPQLREAVGVLYQNLDRMDKAVVHRIADWFAYYLSHNEFTWGWDGWSRDVLREGDELTDQFVFLRETIGKSVRLSYVEKVSNSLPEDWRSKMVPAPLEPYNTSLQEIQTRGGPLSVAVSQLLQAIRKREARTSLMDLLPVGAVLDETTQTDDQVARRRRTILLQCLLQAGSTSFSHALRMSEWYLEQLQSMHTTAAERAHTVEVVADFWRHHDQFLLVVLDKWMSYRILDAESIINWVLGSRQKNELSRSVMWDILHSTMGKVTARAQLIRRRLDELEEELDRRGGADVRERIDKAKQLLEAADTEQTNMFSLVMDRFVDLLSNDLEAGPEFDWAAGFFVDTCRKFCKDLGRDADILYTTVFAPSPKVVYDLFGTVRPLWEAKWR